MADELSIFLLRHVVQEEEAIDWGNLPLHVASFLSAELPPLKYVSSVRAVVIDRDAVLVLHDGNKPHILPGGRRESHESVEETLQREVLEETGYRLHDARPMGFMHFRHLGPKPDGYPYPYPDFLQLVFVAHPGERSPDRMVEDTCVRHSGLVPLRDVDPVLFDPCERLYLMAELERTSQG